MPVLFPWAILPGTLGAAGDENAPPRIVGGGGPPGGLPHGHNDLPGTEPVGVIRNNCIPSDWHLGPGYSAQASFGGVVYYTYPNGRVVTAQGSAYSCRFTEIIPPGGYPDNAGIIKVVPVDEPVIYPRGYRPGAIGPPEIIEVQYPPGYNPGQPQQNRPPDPPPRGSVIPRLGPPIITEILQLIGSINPASTAQCRDFSNQVASYFLDTYLNPLRDMLDRYKGYRNLLAAILANCPNLSPPCLNLVQQNLANIKVAIDVVVGRANAASAIYQGWLNYNCTAGLADPFVTQALITIQDNALKDLLPDTASTLKEYGDVMAYIGANCSCPAAVAPKPRGFVPGVDQPPQPIFNPTPGTITKPDCPPGQIAYREPSSGRWICVLPFGTVKPNYNASGLNGFVPLGSPPMPG